MSFWDRATPLGLLPERAAARWGDKEAMVFGAERLTFAELSGRVDELARGLMAIGLQRGDKVAVWLVNSSEWVILLYALAKVGAVQVPINTRLRSDDMAYVLKHADCTLLITHDVSGPIDYLQLVRKAVSLPEGEVEACIKDPAFPCLRQVVICGDGGGLGAGLISWSNLCERAVDVPQEALDARAAEVSVLDPVLIMFTSGTQGFPKGVLRDHLRLLVHHEDRMAALGITHDDVLLNHLPLFHIFGYADGPLTSLLAGCRQVLTERFDPELSLDLIEQESATTFGGFETHLTDMIEAQQRLPRNLASLRVGLFATGASTSVPVLKRAVEVLAPLRSVTVYGTTEIGANATLSRLDSTQSQAFESCGIPSRGYRIRIVSPETGKDVAEGELGEIRVKSDTMMLGYYKNAEAQREAFDEDGWFKTGDMGHWRPDGYLRYVGRYKDMLKIGGENVDPMEVEAHLKAHPDVAQVSVVGIPDPRLTEVAAAFVVPRSNSQLTERDVLDFCRGRIASFKLPRRAYLLDKLPMTASGKIKKYELRARVAQEESLEPDAVAKPDSAEGML